MKSLYLAGALALGAIIITGAFLISQDTGPSAQNSDSTLTIAATIFPLADIAENIIGDNGEVILIIPPGVSEHDFTVNPEQIVELQSAAALFAIGEGLDSMLVERIQGATENRLPVYSVEKGITLREFGEEEHGHEEEGHEEEEDEHGHGSVDPHYWLTAANAKIIATNIADALTSIDPQHSAQYQQNLEQYLTELEALEQDLQATAADLEQTHFIAMHDAWGYFAEQYGLELVGTYEPIEGREPSPTDLQELQGLVREYGITTFYTEPQKASTPATRFFTQELDLNIEILDPVGGTAERKSYVELMRANMAAIARGSQ